MSIGNRRVEELGEQLYSTPGYRLVALPRVAFSGLE